LVEFFNPEANERLKNSLLYQNTILLPFLFLYSFRVNLDEKQNKKMIIKKILKTYKHRQIIQKDINKKK
tara:strand:+ start:579 stop:785 length:207 start_codon:yes stop_codon:yes gene_type:complete